MLPEKKLSVQDEIVEMLAYDGSSVRSEPLEERKPAAAIRRETAAEDGDHKSHEANINSLQRASEAHLLPYDDPARPLLGFPPADASVTRPDAVSIELERWMRTPTLRRSRYSFSGVNMLLIISTFAPLAYIFAFRSSPPQTDLTALPMAAPVDPQSVTPPLLTQAPLPPDEAQGIAVRMEAESKVQTPSMQKTTRSDNMQSESKDEMRALQPAPGLERNTNDSKTTENTVHTVTDATALRGSANPVLDADDVRSLIDRGTRFFEAGDVGAARLLFRRAARSGNPAAALALGTTYDPLVLKNLGVLGVTADLEEARSWYEIARKSGSPEAPFRLKMLSNPPGQLQIQPDRQPN